MDRAFITVPELAEKLGVSKGRAYQLVASAAIPVVRISPRRIRISKDELDRWLDSKTEVASAPASQETCHAHA